MSAPPYMKLFWGDYHKATRHLTTAQHGAYFLLIGEAWRLGGALPADDSLLALWALCNADEWAAMKGTILAFFTFRRGRWVHARVRDELAKYESISCKRKRAGKAGGLASHENTKENPPAIAEQLTTKPEPEPEPYKNGRVVSACAPVEPDDWPSGDPVKALVADVESAWLDPAKSPGLITTSGRLHAWRREGASWEHDVVPVIRGLCANRRSPVTTWKFFDAAVARAIADNRRALEIPEAVSGVQFRGQGPPSLTERIAAENAESRRQALEMLKTSHG